jgi:hypothetical protein
MLHNGMQVGINTTVHRILHIAHIYRRASMSFITKNREPLYLLAYIHNYAS